MYCSPVMYSNVLYFKAPLCPLKVKADTLEMTPGTLKIIPGTLKMTPGTL